MNLIFCNDDCEFQKNGCCEHKSTDGVQNISNSGCVYFKKRQQEKAVDK